MKTVNFPITHLFSSLIILVLFFFSCRFVYAEQSTYTFGVVPQYETRRSHAIWRPILNHLEKETGYKFQLKGSQTISDFENEFMHGTFDIAYMNPYHIMQANKSQGYIPLVKDVERRLHGVLVVRKDNNISDVTQLEGKRIAFPAPNALGASLLVRQELNDIFHINIFPRYVKTHDSVYLNVLLGKTVAGGGVQKTLNQQLPEYRDALKVIHETTEVSPHPIAVHPRVSVEVKTAVKVAFLKLGETAAGASLLAKIPIKKIGEASIDDYLPLNQMGLERFYVKQY